MFERFFTAIHVCRRGLFVAVCCLAANGLSGQETTRADGATNESFPDGVTPSDVFVRVDLLDRYLDRVLETRGTPPPEPLQTDEQQLGPMHVYQLMLACASRSQELDDQVGVLAVPTLSAKPRHYDPRDVRFVVDLMIDSTERVAKKLAVSALPTAADPVSGKTPTDVFNRGTSVLLKFNALCGYDEISPNEVFAEMVRVTEDTRSILRQADPESRYSIAAPDSAPGLDPVDVYKKCLSIRRVINKHRLALGVAATRLPADPADDSVEPRSVFVQTQIILAELNHLKLLTGTTSSTPLAVPVRKTTLPSDVYRQANLVEHLLLQINSGADVGLAEQPADAAETRD